MRTRVEVLHHGSNDDHEYWSNRSGSVMLRYDRGADKWIAMVDGHTVKDRESAMRGIVGWATPLTAPAAEGLVPLLALQDQLHIILDLFEEWEGGRLVSRAVAASDPQTGAS